MGFLFSKQKQPNLPPIIKEQDILDGNEKAIKKFRNNFRKLGFIVLEMNDDFNKLTKEYKQYCSSFFYNNSFNQKLKYVAKETDPVFKDLGRKPNIGYILTKNKKEYLKFKNTSDISAFPNNNIYNSFKALFKRWKLIVDASMHTVLSEKAKNSRNNNS